MGYVTIFICTAQAAELLGLSPRTLEGYRITGGGPVFYRFGCCVRYLDADVYAWAQARRQASATDEKDASRTVVRWHGRKPPRRACGEGDVTRNALPARQTMMAGSDLSNRPTLNC